MSSDNPVQSNGVVDKTRRLAARGIRVAQLVAARGGAMAADALRRKAKELEIRLDGLHKGLDVKPISDIAFPTDGSGRQQESGQRDHGGAGVRGDQGIFLRQSGSPRSLVSSQSQALLYSLIRNLRPDHVFEIGTYKAGTTEAICRALYANGKGIAHAVDPFRGEYIAAVLKLWPPELFRHVQLHAKDSMAFFGDMERHNIHPALVFVDGNHDYEFAAFDIACGARAITPGGYIVVDNVAQPGPFFAARDFLAANPDWCELGTAATDYDRDKAFDHAPLDDYRNRFHGAARACRARRRRTAVQPRAHPLEFPQSRRPAPQARAAAATGTAHGAGRVARLRRGSGRDHRRSERTRSRRVAKELSITLTPPAQVDGQFAYLTVEPWLIWHGAQPLQLLAAPEPF